MTTIEFLFYFAISGHVYFQFLAQFNHIEQHSLYFRFMAFGNVLCIEAVLGV